MRNNQGLKKLMSIFILLLAAIFSHSLVFGKWAIEVIDSQINCGEYTSLDIDSTDKPHVSYYVSGISVGAGNSMAVESSGIIHLAYYEAEEGNLKYAKWNGNNWAIETIDSANDVGSVNSLVVDSSGVPHVAYYDYSNGDLKYAQKLTGGWQSEVVDAAGDVGSGLCLRLDSNNCPGIVYNDITNNYIKYALWNGNSWDIVKLEDGYCFINNDSFAFNLAGQPAVAYCYYDEQTFDVYIKYAVWDGVNWDKKTVDNPAGAYFKNPILRFDPSGLAHIIYSDTTSIKYTKGDGNTWTTTDFDKTTDLYGQVIDMVLDADNYPRIIYINTSKYLKYLKYDAGYGWVTQNIDQEGDVNNSGYISLQEVGDYSYAAFSTADGILKLAKGEQGVWSEEVIEGNQKGLYYATKEDRTWNTQVVDANSSSGYYTSLKVGLDNTPHISYQDFTEGYLKYAKKGLSGWQLETVSSIANTGKYTSLALDNNQVPSISFINSANNLAYAQKIGDQWEIQIVDIGSFNSYQSMVIDSYMNPHISYYNYSNGDLKYASLNNKVWTSQTIEEDATVKLGAYNSIAIDNQGYPHISYKDETNGYLKYAHWDGSAWIKESVDTTGDVGNYSSLSVDHNGHPHIAYYDTVNGDLKYAHWLGSSWQIQKVDTDNDVGAYCSLKLDSNGCPQISYYDKTNRILKYAKWENSAPVLYYTQETNYTNSGVYPNSGLATESYVFRVKYTDTDEDSPYSGYPRVHILKKGVAITNSPFVMYPINNNRVNVGRVYTCTKTLEASSEYTYYFEAYDQFSTAATGLPTNAASDLDVYTATLSNKNSGTVTIDTTFGQAKLDIPPAAFPQDYHIILKEAGSFPSENTDYDLGWTNIGVELDFVPTQPPAQDLTLTISYQKSISSSLNENKLKLFYFIAAENIWTLEDGTVTPDEDKIVIKTRKNGIFRIGEFKVINNFDNVKIYPNPLRAFAPQTLNFANLPPEADIYIYTVSGDFVRHLKAESSGVAHWDGKNESGTEVASGVYFAVLKGAAKKIFKIAVER